MTAASVNTNIRPGACPPLAQQQSGKRIRGGADAKPGFNGAPHRVRHRFVEAIRRTDLPVDNARRYSNTGIENGHGLNTCNRERGTIQNIGCQELGSESQLALNGCQQMQTKNHIFYMGL